MRAVAACIALLFLASSAAHAQTSTPPGGTGGFEKKNYNYSEWTKGLFSEAVTVTHPGKMIFLAGVGAEDEGATRGVIRHLGDFAGQCRYAYDKIKRLLAAHGASMNDVVKVVTYVTDIRNQVDAGKCRAEALGGAPQPVHTFLNINQLAWPGMLVEVDVIAITKEP
ncbi:MAG TPA: RidA family protein [Pseudolabrys sp.]|nr:RidA family protein [Pseudolabrys sp.]